jgi:thioredoxin
MAVREIGDADFADEVLASEQPAIVDFWSPTCASCRLMKRVMEEIDGERADLRVVTVNIVDAPETAARFGVRSVPTVVVVNKGEAIETVVGALPRLALLDRVDAALSGVATL